jgi:2',3'-cyclic-nucleotide 2'-phosphodiesterase (5'-nucleotidase family)
MKKKLLPIILSIFASFSVFADETLALTILHTNDLHGWMLPFDYSKSNADFMQNEFVDPDYTKQNVGGLARRAALIKKIRANSKNAVVLIDSGDVFTRGPWHKSFYGEPEIEAYNEMSYDMACLGNNEFKGKPDYESQDLLLKILRESEFPWLSANLTVGDTEIPVEGVRPFIVRKYGDIRIAYLGLTSERSRSYPQTKGWTFMDPKIAAGYWVPVARAECDILIAVTHIGVDRDIALASSVEGIDLIIGGDSHTFIPKPMLIANPKGMNVPIAQDGAYGVALGVLNVILEKKQDWSVKSVEGNLIPIDASIEEDPVVKGILDKWVNPAPK